MRGCSMLKQVIYVEPLGFKKLKNCTEKCIYIFMYNDNFDKSKWSKKLVLDSQYKISY
jgi:hypothetical protein